MRLSGTYGGFALLGLCLLGSGPFRLLAQSQLSAEAIAHANATRPFIFEGRSDPPFVSDPVSVPSSPPPLASPPGPTAEDLAQQMRFFVAIAENDKATLVKMLNAGLDPNITLSQPSPEDFQKRFDDDRLRYYVSSEPGFTGLMLATAMGNLHFVRFLLTAGADPMQMTERHKTYALWLAGKYKQVEIMRALMGIDETHVSNSYRITIDTGHQQAILWEHGQVAMVTPISSGRKSHPTTAGTIGGGFGNAMLGTLLMVGMAVALATPFGILSAIYINEYAPASRLSQTVRFVAKLLTGIPSIICGIFAYAVMVLPKTGWFAWMPSGFSAWAGGFALAILILPTILLTAEQALLGVPKAHREASYGLGATTFQTIWRVVLPDGLPAIMTGVMLGVARAAGETAPLIFTALFSFYWINSLNEPTASLSVLIYNFSTLPNDHQVQMAWTASLVLVVLVTIANISAQVVFRKK